MAAHNKLGGWGETVAREFLENKGYKIRHINFRIGHLELDLVAEIDGVLVVAEVKTRSANYLVSPELAVNMTKIKRIVLATHGYIRLFQWEGETRFDIITVIPMKNGYEIDHIEDAFLAPVNF